MSLLYTRAILFYLYSSASHLFDEETKKPNSSKEHTKRSTNSRNKINSFANKINNLAKHKLCPLFTLNDCFISVLFTFNILTTLSKMFVFNPFQLFGVYVCLPVSCPLNPSNYV